MAKLSTGKQDNTTHSALSAIVAGILVVVSGFLVYNYFSKSGKTGLDELNEIAEQPADKGEAQGEQPSQEKQDSSADEAKNETKETQELVKETANWVARDIAPSSLQGDKYTVQKGDTLWEISEGRYGSGFDWVKIRDANADSVGFLPNGSQALIVPGQVLSLP